MTPLQVSMLLHYYWCASPYSEHDRKHANSIAVCEQRRQLISDGLIEDGDEPRAHDDLPTYRTTEKGAVLVKAMCELPMPVLRKAWVMPNKGEKS